jgi:hypothetical protein
MARDRGDNSAFPPGGRAASAALPSSLRCPHLQSFAWQEWICGITGISTDADCRPAEGDRCLPSLALAFAAGEDDLFGLTVIEREAVMRIARDRCGAEIEPARPSMSEAARQRWEAGARRGGILSAAARGLRLWSADDIASLTRLRAAGAKWREIAAALGRSIGSCCQAHQRLILRHPRR